MAGEPDSPARTKAADECRPAKQTSQPVLPPAADFGGSSPSRLAPGPSPGARAPRGWPWGGSSTPGSTNPPHVSGGMPNASH